MPLFLYAVIAAEFIYLFLKDLSLLLSEFEFALRFFYLIRKPAGPVREGKIPDLKQEYQSEYAYDLQESPEKR